MNEKARMPHGSPMKEQCGILYDISVRYLGYEVK